MRQREHGGRISIPSGQGTARPTIMFSLLLGRAASPLAAEQRGGSRRTKNAVPWLGTAFFAARQPAQRNCGRTCTKSQQKREKSPLFTGLFSWISKFSQKWNLLLYLTKSE